jgi:hypothetical protein
MVFYPVVVPHPIGNENKDFRPISMPVKTGVKIEPFPMLPYLLNTPHKGA